jgi:hypothetical protein
MLRIYRMYCLIIDSYSNTHQLIVTVLIKDQVLMVSLYPL